MHTRFWSTDLQISFENQVWSKVVQSNFNTHFQHAKETKKYKGRI